MCIVVDACIRFDVCAPNVIHSYSEISCFVTENILLDKDIMSMKGNHRKYANKTRKRIGYATNLCATMMMMMIMCLRVYAVVATDEKFKTTRVCACVAELC